MKVKFEETERQLGTSTLQNGSMNDLQRRRQIKETKLANIQIVQYANANGEIVEDV